MTSSNAHPNLDIEAISRIDSVPKILEVVALLTGMRFVAVARVTATSWTACAVRDRIDFGLEPGGQLDIKTTICDEIRQHQQPVVFGHASEHPHFSSHHTPALYGLESYISVPIFRKDGSFFGTLCAIDPQPASLDDPKILESVKLFATLIGSQLDLQERYLGSVGALETAQDVAFEREKGIVELAQRISQPIQSLLVDAYLLRNKLEPAAEVGEHIVGIEQSAWQISSLVWQLLGTQHERLEEGSIVREVGPSELEDGLKAAVNQLGTINPRRAINASIRITHSVECDWRRLCQLFLNLASILAPFGDPEHPLQLEATTSDNELTLVVSCRGISDHAPLASLFRPHGQQEEDVAGPGMFIATQIARAHGARLDLQTTGGYTVVTCSVPRAVAAVA